MISISLMLIISHLVLAAGAISFYLVPSGTAVIMLLIGTLIRWMAPSKGAGQNRFLFYIRYGLYYCFFVWLGRHGLGDVIEHAWADRFSFLPVLVCALSLVYLIVCDWLNFRKLTQDQVEQYYAKA